MDKEQILDFYINFYKWNKKKYFQDFAVFPSVLKM